MASRRPEANLGHYASSWMVVVQLFEMTEQGAKGAKAGEVIYVSGDSRTVFLGAAEVLLERDSAAQQLELWDTERRDGEAV